MKSKLHKQDDTLMRAFAEVFRRGAQIVESMQLDALHLARIHQELAAAITAACDRAITEPSAGPPVEAETVRPRMLRFLDVLKRVG